MLNVFDSNLPRKIVKEGQNIVQVINKILCSGDYLRQTYNSPNYGTLVTYLRKESAIKNLRRNFHSVVRHFSLFIYFLCGIIILKRHFPWFKLGNKFSKMMDCFLISTQDKLTKKKSQNSFSIHGREHDSCWWILSHIHIAWFCFLFLKIKFVYAQLFLNFFFFFCKYIFFI